MNYKLKSKNPATVKLRSVMASGSIMPVSK